MYIIPIELYIYKTKSKIEGLIERSSLTKNKIMKHITYSNGILIIFTNPLKVA